MSDGIFLITPTGRDALCTGYMRGLIALNNACIARKLPLQIAYHCGGSNIHLARNECLHQFEKSAYDSMLFVDDDVQFRSDDALAMYDSKLPFTGGIYPRKTLNWDQAFDVYEKTGNRQSARLAAFQYPAVFSEPIRARQDNLAFVAADRLPTGFMMIRREVVDAIREKRPDLHYGDGHLNAFASYVVDGKLPGEDYAFSDLVSSLGFQPFVYVRAQLAHYGHMKYEGFEWGPMLGGATHE